MSDNEKAEGGAMYAIEISFARDPYGDRSYVRREADPELAAQVYESEAGTPRSELCALIEELDEGKRLESVDDETGKTVAAFELVEAVV